MPNSKHRIHFLFGAITINCERTNITTYSYLIQQLSRYCHYTNKSFYAHVTVHFRLTTCLKAKVRQSSKKSVAKKSNADDCQHPFHSVCNLKCICICLCATNCINRRRCVLNRKKYCIVVKVNRQLFYIGISNWIGAGLLQ